MFRILIRVTPGDPVCGQSAAMNLTRDGALIDHYDQEDKGTIYPFRERFAMVIGFRAHDRDRAYAILSNVRQELERFSYDVEELDAVELP